MSFTPANILIIQKKKKKKKMTSKYIDSDILALHCGLVIFPIIF